MPHCGGLPTIKHQPPGLTLLSALLQQLEGVQPTTTPDDNVLAEHIIMSDPRIRQLLAERYGITDPDLIVFDPWSLHGTPEKYKGRRLMQVQLRAAAARAVFCHAGSSLWRFARHVAAATPLVDTVAAGFVADACFQSSSIHALATFELTHSAMCYSTG